MSERLAAARQRLQAGAPLLVSRLRHIGDVVLTLPLLQALRHEFPQAPLHYLADPIPLSVLDAHPDVAVRWPVPRGIVASVRLVAALRRQRFAAAIDLFSNPRSAQLIWASGAAFRIGEARRGRRHLYHVQRRLLPGVPALEQHLGACAALGFEPGAARAPRMHLQADEMAGAAARLRRLVHDEPFVLFNPGATHVAKEWPNAAAVQLVMRLRRRQLWVLLATPPQRAEPSAAIAQRLAGDSGVVLLPPLPWRDFCAILARARGVVSVDGGTVHAAVALERPTVALFGPTDAGVWFPYARFGPYRVLDAGPECARTPLAACSQACMSRILPEQVEATLLELLQGRNAP